MSPAVQRRIVQLALFIVAGALFFSGIHWGLPSRQADRFLFGDTPVWSGKQIMALAGERSDDANLGADISRHLLQNRDRILWLNDNDVSRAQIIRRYRLYTAQPDEHVPMMVIGRMRPSKFDFDPRYYQYGGLFIYPLAVWLKLASLHGVYLKIVPDAGYYIDHPEEFGRFYVVARAWAAVWGLVGVWAVFWIARKFTGGLWFPAAAALAFAMMPVTINQAHEAKPHLQGVVLELLAVMAAYRYFETGSRRHACLTGALCGAAFGSVLYGLYAFAVLPAMVLLRREKTAGRVTACLLAGNVGLIVYAITNPYVLINLFHNPAVLHSNLANTGAMYHVSGVSGLRNAVSLIGEGASYGLAAAGALAIIAALLVRRWRRATEPPGGRFAMGVLLAGPFVPVCLQFFILAAGKPGEYGRFALYLDAVLAIAAMSGIAFWVRNRLIASVIVICLLIAVAYPGLNYLHNYVRDASGATTRWTAALEVQRMTIDRPSTVAIFAEPAPYSVPPIDLFRNRIVLLPAGYVPNTATADILLRTVDDPRTESDWERPFDRYSIVESQPCRISWANKPIVIDVAPPGRKENSP